MGESFTRAGEINSEPEQEITLEQLKTLGVVSIDVTPEELAIRYRKDPEAMARTMTHREIARLAELDDDLAADALIMYGKVRSQPDA